MRRTPLNAVLVVSLLVTPVVASCGAQTSGNLQTPGISPTAGPNSSQTVAPGPQGTAAEAEPAAPASSVIGAQGGTVSLKNGTSVTIPAGALTGDQTVTVTESPWVPGPARSTQLGPVVSFAPDHLTFAKPVTVTLTYDPELLPPGKSASDIQVFTAPDGSRDYAPLPTTPVDATHVAATTTHFTHDTPVIKDPCKGSGQAEPPSCKPHGGMKDIRAVCAGTRIEMPCMCPASQVNKEGKPCPSSCVLDEPQCPVFKEVNANVLEIYNLAALPLPPVMGWQAGFLTMGLPAGPGALPQKSMEQLAWVHWLAAKFYFNNDHIDHYNIKIDVVPGGNPGDNWGAFVPGTNQVGSFSAPEAWCPPPPGVCPPHEDKPPTMYVDPLSFSQLSPADLLVVLGHETIHYMQNERPLPARHLYYSTQNAIQDIRELEAYAWELGDEGPIYPSYFEGVGKNKAKTCFSKFMTEADRQTQTCYVAEAKLNVWTTLRETASGAKLKQFFDTDPYGQIWARNNPGWQNWARGEKPHIPYYCCWMSHDPVPTR